MHWRLAILLALWLGTLAPPLAMPPVKETAPTFESAGPDTGLILEPPYVEIEGCNGLPQTRAFRLVNNSGAAGTFDLDYLVVDGHATLAGPAQLFLADGQAVDFHVTLTPRLCALPGERAAGRIVAAGNGQTISAEIVQTVYVAPRWEVARPHLLPCPDWLVETAIDPGDGQEYVYVAGCNTRSTYRYDPRHDTWTTLAAVLPDWLYGGDAAVYQGRMYARSDGLGSQKQRLHIYDVAADAWSSAAVPVDVADRSHYEAVELDGRIYFLGGANMLGSVSAAVTRYDPDTGTWSSVAPMLHPRAMAMAWAYLDRIYIAGGYDAAGPLSSTEVYDPERDTWTENPALFTPLPAPRYGAGDARLDGQLWLIGGFGTTEVDETLYWTAADNAWHSGPRLASAASHVEAAAVAGALYAVGGMRGSEWLADNQRLVICPDRSQCAGWLDGQVYDAELPLGAATCTAARLSLTPGGSVPVTPGTGRYGPLSLLPGSYLLEANAPGYSLEAENVIVEHGATITQNIGIWRPRVEARLSPSRVALGPDASLTIPLRITNTGHLGLEYRLVERAPAPSGDTGDELPWLRPGATAGEIAPLQAGAVELTFDCAAAEPGQVLTGTLVLTHGDPCLAPIELKLELDCGRRPSYVYLPLLLRTGGPDVGSAVTLGRKQCRQPVVPARTRP